MRRLLLISLLLTAVGCTRFDPSLPPVTPSSEPRTRSAVSQTITGRSLIRLRVPPDRISPKLGETTVHAGQKVRVVWKDCVAEKITCDGNDDLYQWVEIEPAN